LAGLHSAFIDAWEKAEEVVEIRDGQVLLEAPRLAAPDPHGEILGGPVAVI
jgi:hypothetical protein